MICALVDYYQYRQRTNRYSKNICISIMGGAFEKRLPDEIVPTLREGDALFVQTFDSWLSWLVMYLTQTEISHIAFYMGNRMILHATLSGVVKEKIDNLYGTGVRILPFTFRHDINKKLEDINADNYVGKPYDFKGVIQKALLILSGRAWSYFKWHFVLDIAIFCLFLDLLIFMTSGFIIFSYFLLGYLLIICINYLRARVKGKSFKFVGDPGHAIYQMIMVGALPIFDPSSLCDMDEKIISKNILKFKNYLGRIKSDSDH